MKIFSRTELLIGEKNVNKLRTSKVMIFGLGGVGSYTAEALVRCGIGKFMLVDGDTICASNINRQLIALHTTVGRAKTDVMLERMLMINPDASVTAVQIFADNENIIGLLDDTFDYVIDAIDDVAAKLAIIERCGELGIPVISSMGAGNKLHPERFMIADIYETKVCPLAKVMRRELRRRGVNSLKVCYSDEEPLKPANDETGLSGRRPPGSISFVPSVAGLIIAGQTVRDILSLE